MRTSYDAVPGKQVQTIAEASSLGRIAVGLATFARPEILPRALGIDRGTARRSSVMMRFFAGREIGLGAGAVYAFRTGGDATPWLVAQAIGDAGDALALAAAVRSRHVAPIRGAALSLAALSGVLGAALAVRTLRSGRK